MVNFSVIYFLNGASNQLVAINVSITCTVLNGPHLGYSLRNNSVEGYFLECVQNILNRYLYVFLESEDSNGIVL